MSQQKREKGNPILEGQEQGIECGKKEDVNLTTNFEYDDTLIDDTERMSRQLAGKPRDIAHGDAKEGVETRLRSAPAEPRFNVMSTTASGAIDLPDTKLGGDVQHLGKTEQRKGFEPGYAAGMTDNSGKQ